MATGIQGHMIWMDAELREAIYYDAGLESWWSLVFPRPPYDEDEASERDQSEADYHSEDDHDRLTRLS